MCKNSIFSYERQSALKEIPKKLGFRSSFWLPNFFISNVIRSLDLVQISVFGRPKKKPRSTPSTTLQYLLSCSKFYPRFVFEAEKKADSFFSLVFASKTWSYLAHARNVREISDFLRFSAILYFALRIFWPVCI